jgi:hypothetical protein
MVSIAETKLYSVFQVAPVPIATLKQGTLVQASIKSEPPAPVPKATEEYLCYVNNTFADLLEYFQVCEWNGLDDDKNFIKHGIEIERKHVSTETMIEICLKFKTLYSNPRPQCGMVEYNLEKGTLRFMVVVQDPSQK